MYKLLCWTRNGTLHDTLVKENNPLRRVTASPLHRTTPSLIIFLEQQDTERFYSVHTIRSLRIDRVRAPVGGKSGSRFSLCHRSRPETWNCSLTGRFPLNPQLLLLLNVQYHLSFIYTRMFNSALASAIESLKPISRSDARFGPKLGDAKTRAKKNNKTNVQNDSVIKHLLNKHL